MFVLYNIVQLVLLAVFFPFIALFVLARRKYRDRIRARLGFGLTHLLAVDKITTVGGKPPTIWLHALSVGEVTSAVPLIAGLRKTYPEKRIIVSVATRTGKQLADRLLATSADHIIDGPLDILPVIVRFTKVIQPELYILVETDFWPNILLFLRQKNIPTILVNGRISEKSLAGYHRLRLFFSPMLQSFTYVCLQTEHDRENLEQLGLLPEKLYTLGNLKLATQPANTNPDRTSLATLLPNDRIFFICGSTHPGEEEILIACYLQLRKTHPELFLILAPRNPDRAAEIRGLAAAQGLTATLRSSGTKSGADLFILDSIGELITFYSLAHIAFVGGSLVKLGGHNPIEPAVMGIPVIFGPNMQDFSEIATALLSVGGATEISDDYDLTELLKNLVPSPELRAAQGLAARTCIEKQPGVIKRHLALIDQVL